MDILREIKRLVINECAYYSKIFNGIQNYCDKEFTKDLKCSLFENGRCYYFEKNVLPMNPQLEALYKAKELGYELSKEDEENITSLKGKVKIHCKRCGKIFQADNRKRFYCDLCKRIIRREKAMSNFKTPSKTHQN